jgi:hypothetical protein
MTIKEKEAKINEYCPTDCDNCPIDDICSEVYGDFLGHPEKCEEAYDIISNKKEFDNVNTQNIIQVENMNV